MSVAGYLSPSEVDTFQLPDIPRLNAGFTKIYSMLVDGFIIFDSRVAAALAALIRIFADHADLVAIPLPLRIALPPGRAGVRHVPGFPLAVAGSSGIPAFASSNIRASWLVGEMAQRGRFADVSSELRGRALEAALFMIGYTVSDLRVGY